MKFRKLSSCDIFPMCTIISKIGIKEFKSCFESEEIRKLMSKKGGEDLLQAVGMTIFMDIAGILMTNLPKCEKEIYSFLASITESDEKTLKEMDIAEFAELIIEFFKKEEFKDFMKVVSKFLK